ncbi:MAG: hypothetical protein KC613_21150 [Myxococcales bacterium]|nr:hypothetical protein [Myxococcales bacterium]
MQRIALSRSATVGYVAALSTRVSAPEVINLMLRKLFATPLALLLSLQFGCYNTYNITLDEMAKVQEGGESNAVEITTEEGEPVVVSENTKLGVTTTGGTYRAVSPFNFTLTGAQLVAPDEDLLLGRDEIASGNVKLVSGTKTGLLVAGGVAVIVGAALFIALTAEPEKGFGEQ